MQGRFPHVRPHVPVIPLQPSDYYEAAYSRAELLAAECAPGTPRSTRVLVSRRWWRMPELVTICVDRLPKVAR